MKRRIGKIFVSAELIMDNGLNIDEILKVTSKFVVVRCEYLYFSNEFEYIAICPEFDEVEPSEIPPTYLVELKSEVLEEGNPAVIVDVKFIRQG